MIPADLLKGIMNSKVQNRQVIRPCEPSWSLLPEERVNEIKWIVSDAAKHIGCQPDDLCVAVVVDDAGQIRAVHPKTKKPKKLTGWLRLKAAWNMIWKGRI